MTGEITQIRVGQRETGYTLKLGDKVYNPSEQRARGLITKFKPNRIREGGGFLIELTVMGEDGRTYTDFPENWRPTELIHGPRPVTSLNDLIALAGGDAFRRPAPVDRILLPLGLYNQAMTVSPSTLNQLTKAGTTITVEIPAHLADSIQHLTIGAFDLYNQYTKMEGKSDE